MNSCVYAHKGLSLRRMKKAERQLLWPEKEILVLQMEDKDKEMISCTWVDSEMAVSADRSQQTTWSMSNQKMHTVGHIFDTLWGQPV